MSSNPSRPLPQDYRAWQQHVRSQTVSSESTTSSSSVSQESFTRQHWMNQHLGSASLTQQHQRSTPETCQKSPRSCHTSSDVHPSAKSQQFADASHRDRILLQLHHAENQSLRLSSDHEHSLEHPSCFNSSALAQEDTNEVHENKELNTQDNLPSTKSSPKPPPLIPIDEIGTVTTYPPTPPSSAPSPLSDQPQDLVIKSGKVTDDLNSTIKQEQDEEGEENESGFRNRLPHINGDDIECRMNTRFNETPNEIACERTRTYSERAYSNITTEIPSELKRSYSEPAADISCQRIYNRSSYDISHGKKRRYSDMDNDKHAPDDVFQANRSHEDGNKRTEDENQINRVYGGDDNNNEEVEHNRKSLKILCTEDDTKNEDRNHSRKNSTKPCSDDDNNNEEVNHSEKNLSLIPGGWNPHEECNARLKQKLTWIEDSNFLSGGEIGLLHITKGQFIVLIFYFKEYICFCLYIGKS